MTQPEKSDFPARKSDPERRIERLVRRAGPFVNVVAVMAEDRSKALGWLADAGVEVGTLSKYDPGLLGDAK